MIWDDAVAARVSAALADKRGMLSTKGATEAEVAAAELSLGIAFPPSYRAFLLRHNGGYVRGMEILWLVPPPFNKQHPDLVWYNLRYWKRFAWTHKRLLVIPTDEWDYFIELSKPGPDGECPIIIREHSGEEEVVAPDFPTLLERLAFYKA